MKIWTLKWISGVTVAALAILVVLSLGNSPLGAQGDSSVNSISVSGSGEVFGTPDIAYVNLGVDHTDRSVGQAIDNANLNMAGVVSAVKEAGVDEKDIQTTGFNLFPEDRYDPQTGQATGERIYHVSMSVNVIVRDIANVSKVIQAGLNGGANTINGLSFGFADPTALEDQAREKAAADARARAQKLAAAFGVTLGAPIQISETFGSGAVPVAFGRGGDALLAQAAPQINAGQLSISVQINVTFAMGN
jgi:hypothetical protein